MALVLFLSAAGLVVMFLTVGAMVAVAMSFKLVEPGQALVVTKPQGTAARLTGMLAIPIVHTVETMDLSTVLLAIDKRGPQGSVVCKDGVRADIEGTLYIRVRDEPDDILRVAESIGCQRARDPETIRGLIEASLDETLRAYAATMTFVELLAARDLLGDTVAGALTEATEGYVVDAFAVTFMDQTPIAALDPHNILDARAIEEVTRLTSEMAHDIHILKRQQQHESELQLPDDTDIF